MLATCSTQHIGNMFWALARIGFHHEPLLDALAAAAIKPSSALLPQELSNTAWSMATILMYHHPALEAISSASLAKISECGP